MVYAVSQVCVWFTEIFYYKTNKTIAQCVAACKKTVVGLVFAEIPHYNPKEKAFKQCFVKLARVAWKINKALALLNDDSAFFGKLLYPG